MPKFLGENKKKEDESHTRTTSKRRDSKHRKDMRKSIPPRPTRPQHSLNKKHKRKGNLAGGLSESDSKESIIDSEVLILMQSISSKSSIDKQDSDSLQSSCQTSNQNDHP